MFIWCLAASRCSRTSPETKYSDKPENAGMLPLDVALGSIFQRGVFHWFRPVVLWHPGGKRHGCHFIVFNGSAQWFAGAQCLRSSLSPNVFYRSFLTSQWFHRSLCLFLNSCVCIGWSLRFYKDTFLHRILRNVLVIPRTNLVISGNI